MKAGRAKPPDPGDPRLQWAISEIVTSTRILRACEQLHVRTIGDFLTVDPDRMLASRGVGPGSYRAARRAVRRFLEKPVPAAPLALSPQEQSLPIAPLAPEPKLQTALLKHKIQTVGDFLATPRAQLLSGRGLDAKSYETVLDRIHALVRSRTQDPGLLPDALLRFPTSGLGLAAELDQRLLALGLGDLGTLLRTQPDWLLQQTGVGFAGVQQIREALDRTLRAGLDQVATPGPNELESFSAFFEKVTSVLEPVESDWLRMRLLAPTAGRPTAELGMRLGLGKREARQLDSRVRRKLHERAAGLMARLRRDGERELEAYEGILEPGRIAAGTLLADAAKGTRDPLLPLRLLAFCFPRLFHLHGEMLTTLSLRHLPRVRRLLRAGTRRGRLPVAVSSLDASLREQGIEVPAGLLQRLLRELPGILIAIDPDLGDVVRATDLIADRVAAILDEQGPLTVEDLLFHYRDRHRRGSVGRLQQHLYADARFLEVGPRTWSLRARHSDELDIAKGEAERIVNAIIAGKRRASVREFVQDADRSPRTVYLLIDCMRRNPALRYLGRGDFCPASSLASQAMLELRQMFRRAMGEVPLARFLANQPESRRRKIHRLLSNNRAFIEPSPDRIDVLTNYPFNEERLARLLEIVDRTLDQRGGYASLDRLIGAINAGQLGGAFLTRHFLRDLLRRHAQLDFLPSGIVARPSLGLVAWIMSRAHDAIRCAGVGLTIAEILLDHPELAEFADCLEQLLEQDPLVQTQDGQRYQLV